MTYPVVFESIWDATGRQGTKFKALKAWKKAGKPSLEVVAPRWAAYLLSADPVRGFVQHLSTWLNGRGHTQDWAPASSRAPDGVSEKHRRMFEDGRKWAEGKS